jgi:predicted phage-related endonuclease
MNDEELTRLRVATQRELAEIRKAEQRMAAGEHELEHELERFEDDIKGAEETIDLYLRQENWGREPEHPPYWRTGGKNNRGRRSLTR